METGDSLEIPISGNKYRPMLSDNRRDQEVEIADRQSPAVELTSQLGRLLRGRPVEGEDLESSGKCKAPREQPAPSSVAGTKELRKGRGGNRQDLLVGLPLERLLSSAGVTPEQIETERSVEGSHVLLAP